jgi:hypothetical protein
MSLKIIGAGFGRTGTLSLKNALEELGYGPCYHMFELMQNPAHVRVWEQALNGRSPDWDELFQHYPSTVDFPACLYYKELLARYPEAKVILTVRDPERWYGSARGTIFRGMPFRKALKMTFLMPFSTHARALFRVAVHNFRLLNRRTFRGNMRNKEHTIGVYLRHIEEVKRFVPASQLLVYEVAEGWAPLCRFLGVDTPAAPFPKANEGADYRALIERAKKI